MSSVVCQPRLIEFEPIILRQKLLTPPLSITIPLPQQNHLEEIDSHDTIITDDEEDDNNNNKIVNRNDELSGWSFLDSLANPSQCHRKVTEKMYVHPMVKSTLSSKSLEMCTESLGCETGSDISEINEEFGSGLGDNERLIAMRKSRQFIKKVVTTSFPPPLTSISGSDGVRVKPHREGGQLVLKAVSISASGTNFQTERTNGRLKLSLVKDSDLKAAMEEETYNVDNDCEYEDDVYDDDDDDNEEEQEHYVGQDMGGNIGNVEGGVRPSRCKEGGGGRNKVTSDWRSFWVAIS